MLPAIIVLLLLIVLNAVTMARLNELEERLQRTDKDLTRLREALEKLCFAMQIYETNQNHLMEIVSERKAQEFHKSLYDLPKRQG